MPLDGWTRKRGITDTDYRQKSNPFIIFWQHNLIMYLFGNGAKWSFKKTFQQLKGR